MSAGKAKTIKNFAFDGSKMPRVVRITKGERPSSFRFLIEREQRNVLRAIETACPGSLALIELLGADADGADRDRARRQFSRWIDHHPINHTARQRLTEISRAEGKHALAILHRSIFPEALILVLSYIDRRQTIRLGRKWIKGRGGKKANVKPCDLPWFKFVQWVKLECCKAASAILLGLDYPEARDDALARSAGLDDSRDYGEDDDKSPLAALLDQERKLEIKDKLLPALSRQEKAFFNLILQGKDLANTNLSAENVRTLLSRVGKKSRLLLNG
jgi:hypothetical protein